MRPVLLVAGLGLALAACGSAAPSSRLVIEGGSVAAPYDGPMRLPLDHSKDADVLARSGAAGRALECTGTPYDGGGADYAGGLGSVKEDPEKALADYVRSNGVAWGMPTEGYRIERRADRRVLFSYDVGGRTRAAFVLGDGITDGEHHTGWGVEAWAQCDPAELPAAFTDRVGLGVWTDAAGERVPVAEVLSFRGDRHCDWQDVTFLQVDEEPSAADPRQAQEYFRDPEGVLAGHLDGTFTGHARLPGDARDTGWRRAGRELWLVPDRSAAYLVNLEDETDVERWPASTQPIYCD